MCRFYKVFYRVYTELGLEIGIDSVVSYAISVAHAVECDIELYSSEGKTVEVIGYLVDDGSSHFIR